MKKRKDYSSEGFTHRVKEGREVWEPFVMQELAKQGITIESSTEREDLLQKIDGWYNKQPVQIKIRNTSAKDRNDLSFELVQNYNPIEMLSIQMNHVSTKGRDWKSSAKHYFLLNRDSNIIYHLDGTKIKQLIREAVEELEDHDFDLRNDSFLSEKSIEIKATKDKDANSHTPSKVMVFIPVKLAMIKEYILASQT